MLLVKIRINGLTIPSILRSIIIGEYYWQFLFTGKPILLGYCRQSQSLWDTADNPYLNQSVWDNAGSPYLNQTLLGPVGCNIVGSPYSRSLGCSRDLGDF